MAEPTVYETVKMQDGRIVDFPGKSKMQKTASVTAEGKLQVILDFRNGESRTFTLPEELLNKFALHGAEQKLGDEIAGVKDLDDAIIAVDELIDRLYNGEWSVKREASGLAGTSVLVKAMVEFSGKPVETIKAFLKAKSHAEKVALRGSAQLKPIVDRLEAEKAAKGASKIDTDALLSGLDEPTAE